MTRLILSSIQNFATTLNSNPQLLDIPAFVGLRPMLEQLKADSKGCGCKKTDVYSSYKTYFENAVSALTDSDRASLKSTLNVQQICYYTRNKAGVLELICL